MRVMRAFLWISVIAWGVGLGAKLFDLLVLAGAWSYSPPASLKLLPYGPGHPVDTGAFFLPTSAVILASSLGVLIAARGTPRSYRLLLAVPAALFLVMFAVTVVVFWPMNAALYYYSKGQTGGLSEADIARLAHRWVTLDWTRVAGMLVGYLCTLRAFSTTPSR